MDNLGFIAHVRFEDDGKPVEHWLEEHLRDVAKLAAEFADLFGGDWAEVAGLWHDIGKYNPKFQQYLADKTGYELENAHIEDETIPGKVNHSAAGALYASSLDKDPKKRQSKVLGYLIAGHHAGLPDWRRLEAGGCSLEEILEQGEHLERVKAVFGVIPNDITSTALPSTPPRGSDRALWIRMLFSSLVDADFLDTECFMDRDKFAQRGHFPEIPKLLGVFNQHMASFSSKAKPGFVNELRSEILQDCRRAAKKPPGLFSLTVPTGGGKTLSGMAFALEHAVAHNKSRVIYAIPYTSIIEQTANIYRHIFGGCVVEHHSNLDPNKENAQSRLATENWDAPIIVTTNVQLFESLFASRTSRCRKLHNLVNSIIVLDEAQLLPTNFLNPILDVMKTLSTHYGVTFVLSTATQPALQSIYDSFGKAILKGFESANVTEIIPNCERLFEKLERVVVEFPDDLKAEQDWGSLAEEIYEHGHVLVIVNTKSQALELCRVLPPETIYLTTNICGRHRSYLIKKIRRNLRQGIPTRIVSTSLIEAGVDISFPVVYRALSGMDSLAQAAGRCNREGLLKERGRLIVFVPPGNNKLQGDLKRAASASRSLIPALREHPLHHNNFKAYFEQFYSAAPSLDSEDIIGLLTQDASELKIQFRTAAQRFRLIKDEGIPVLVNLGKSRKLIKKLKHGGPSRDLMRKLQRYTVTIREKDKFRLELDLHELPNMPGLYEQVTPGLYDPKYGLMTEPVQLTPSDLNL